MWSRLRGAINVVKFINARSKLSTQLLAPSSHPLTRNLVCKTKTNVAAITMNAWRWLVHPCGRASPRMLARASASYCGATDAAAV
eukprot:7066205-Pyramimonas_sp.AAC.1